MGETANPKTIAARLPGHLGQLAKQGHGGAALILVREWGGQKRYIPKQPTDGPLTKLIGLNAATALIKICGGREIDVPSPGCLGDNAKAEILRAEGGTRDIAKDLKVTERYVRMVRNAGAKSHAWKPRRREKPKDDRQIDLVDFLKSSQ